MTTPPSDPKPPAAPTEVPGPPRVPDDDGMEVLSPRIPKAVVRRLALYARALQRLEGTLSGKVSSEEIARLLGCKSAQVRKDLAYFGQFGTPGYGYNIADLRKHIRRILGTDRDFRVAVIGVGNLGSALLSYPGFAKQGYRMVCGFDSDPVAARARVKSTLPIHAITELVQRLRENHIDIACLAVPADAAQPVAELCIEAGVQGILNFVPSRIRVDSRIHIHHVDLALELESLGYYIR